MEPVKQIRQLNVENIHMRDPFIFTDAVNKKYYLYGTTDVCDGAANLEPHIEVYTSDDLITFTGPFIAFYPPTGYWGVKSYWAPEVYKHEEKYFMFATFKGGIGADRGTAVLKSETPQGPFKPHSNGHVTLKGHECLDGTLHVDAKNNPWIIFCHEWTELFYGRIEALPLSPDFKYPLTQDSITLVDTKTDKLPWIRQFEDPRIEKTGFLTDAPCIHRTKDNSLLLLWSSYSIQGYKTTGSGGYVVATAKSSTGEIQGRWEHNNVLLLDNNIGHVSIFKDFSGNLRLSGHCNDTKHGQEYPVFLHLLEKNDNISIAHE